MPPARDNQPSRKLPPKQTTRATKQFSSKIQVRDCVYITDHAYTREEVLEMEQTILRRLKFELTVPTPWTFLVRFLKVARATDRQHHRAQYYLERCLQEHDGLSFRPSMLAAASVFLARIPDSGLDHAWVRLAERCVCVCVGECARREAGRSCEEEVRKESCLSLYHDRAAC